MRRAGASVGGAERESAVLREREGELRLRAALESSTCAALEPTCVRGREEPSNSSSSARPHKARTRLHGSLMHLIDEDMGHAIELAIFLEAPREDPGRAKEQCGARARLRLRARGRRISRQLLGVACGGSLQAVRSSGSRQQLRASQRGPVVGSSRLALDSKRIE